MLMLLCCRCVTGFVSLILKALQGRFVIPDFSTFSEETQKLFSRCRQLSVQVSPALVQSSEVSIGFIFSPVSGGRTLPVLFLLTQEREKGNVENSKWGVSICTVDGQRYGEHLSSGITIRISDSATNMKMIGSYFRK